MKKFVATIPAGSGISFDNRNRDIGLQHITFDAFVIEEVDTNSYVRVRVGAGYPLTYIDPTGGLEINDQVLVPYGSQNMLVAGIVEDLGRGDCPDHVKIKKVRSFVVDTLELSTAA